MCVCSSSAVHLVAFHVYGRERTRWAEVLARSASDAHLLVDNGNHQACFLLVLVLFLLCLGIERHHGDGAHRAVARAVAAGLSVGDGHTVLSYPHGVTDVYGCLLGACGELDGTRRTHLRAACALRTAVAALVRHFGLHEGVELCGWPQHVVRTLGDAQLARRTVLSHVPCRQRSRRSDACLSLGAYLFLYLCQSAVQLHLLLGYGSRCSRRHRS